MDIEATIQSVKNQLAKVAPIAAPAQPIAKEDLAGEKHPVKYVLKAAKNKLIEAKTTGKLHVAGLIKAFDTVLKNFEDTNAAAPAIENDPMQQVPTETQADIVSMVVTQGSTSFAEDLSALGKAIVGMAATLQKLVDGKTETELVKVAKEMIAKAGPASAKLDQLKSMLNLQDVSNDDYDLRWKVSSMVGLLADASALETILGSGEAAPAATKEATEKAAGDRVIWPTNMAKAKVDPKTGAFVDEEPAWGRDKVAG